jgi:signal transduction histidine kinase
MLDDLGLVPALKWQAREVSKRTGMDVIVDAELEGCVLPDEYRTCIYRIVQEAHQNCAKHSKASKVKILVEIVTGQLWLSVQDNGVGFDARDAKEFGKGVDLNFPAQIARHHNAGNIGSGNPEASCLDRGFQGQVGKE